MASQRDSAINLEIAKLGRADNVATREIAIAAAKDSATMRIIAYVTLAFLPSTFVAVSELRCSNMRRLTAHKTFFSTTFFDFKPAESDNRVVSWWLWLYFVVSMPLTVAVMVMWRVVSKQKEQLLLSKLRTDAEGDKVS